MDSNTEDTEGARRATENPLRTEEGRREWREERMAYRISLHSPLFGLRGGGKTIKKEAVEKEERKAQGIPLT